MHFDFNQTLAQHKLPLSPLSVETLQLNITKLCNQVCLHCHVDASPKRREMMSEVVMDQCLQLLKTHASIRNLDITGGAPELHAGFKQLVRTGRSLGKKVLVRHNLTVSLDPHPLTRECMNYLPEFFAEQKVELISSLPCYTEQLTNKQRGDGVFQKSIAALNLLNKAGFGQPGTGLILNLVYNPVGAHLPPPQAALEADYKRELYEHFGIVFNNLYALTNLPVHRFKAQLLQSKNYKAYMEKLVLAFNPVAAQRVMCRTLLSVGFDGRLYDCDFNQMLGMNLGTPAKPLTVFDFDEAALLDRPIKFANHCYGCTAGAGSSCSGAVT